MAESQPPLPPAQPHPPVEPYESGLVEVGDGNAVHWEVSGNPDGRPVVLLHGGPGATSTARRRSSAFDPSVFRIIRFDQRGCGRSTPHASDPAADMSVNTTGHLIADMELLREHLGIDTWAVFGGSWGVTLATAYTQAHPERVTAAVLVAVSLARPREIDWLYGGAARFFPEAHRRFREGVPAGQRDGSLPAAYAQLMEHPDRAVRERAAVDWVTWEDTVLSLEDTGKPALYADRPDDALLAFVRICAHYYAHYGWLGPDQVIEGARALGSVPAAIVHGRRDLSCPAETAWELHRAWPGSRLTIVDDAGHKGSPAMSEALREAVEAVVSR